MKTFHALVLGALLLLFAGGCSRERSLAEDPSLKGYRVLALPLRQRPLDMQQLLDSLGQLDTLRVPDTLTATVGDTLWLLGHFKGRNENVGNHYWEVHSGAPRIVPNDTVIPVVFDSVGIYRYQFVVVDRIGGRDTAGQQQRLRIIDTPPAVAFAIDTLWSGVDGGALLRFTAADSFGTITQIRVDWNGNGHFDTILEYPQSVVELRVPADTAAMVWRWQRVRVEVVDEDGNITVDSTTIHFNSPPEVVLDYPPEGARIDIFSRFAFHYHAVDVDNPQDLRYFLRVGPGSVLTNTYLVASNITARSWEAIGADSVRAIDSALTGRIYWQLWATDGFDTSYSEVRSLWLGDPRIRFGSARGNATMQGMDDHRGLRVSLVRLQPDPYRQYGETDIQGNWDVPNLEPGWYRIEVEDTLGTGYPIARRDSLLIELAEEAQAGNLVLVDTVPPRIFLSSIPPLIFRGTTLNLNGVFADSGSQVHPSSIQGWLDSTPVSGIWDAFFWSVVLDSLRNGDHLFRLRVADRVGNRSDTLRVPFRVDNKAIVLTVNGDAAAIVKIDVDLTFTAVVSGARPGLAGFLWDIDGDGTWDDTTQVVQDSTGNLVRAFSNPVPTGRLIVMAIDSVGLSIRDTVQYVVVSTNAPAVLFASPSQDTTITPNDSIAFRVLVSDPDGVITTVEWDLDGNGSWEVTGDVSELTRGLRFGGPGVYQVGVRVTDDDGLRDSTYRQISVASDPPSVQVAVDTLTVKINSQVSLGAVATDAGNIVRYEWKCGGEPFAEYPGPSIAVQAPALATESWLCIIRVTDDDDEQALDTTRVRVVQGLPSVVVARDFFAVTIRDSIVLQAIASDPVGTIVQVEWSCGLPGVAGVTNWNPVSRPDTVVVAPAVAADPWLCVIRVTDDDAQTAMDTVRVRVVLDPPRVQVIDESLVVRINEAIALDAIAYDSAGSIVKYEWSCGGAGVAGQIGWRQVQGPDTLWTAPSTAQPNWMCVIRVTDDDALTARDTMFIEVVQDEPQVTVTIEYMEVRVEDVYDVDAVANDAMGVIALHEWSCGLPGVAGSSGTWIPVPTTAFTTVAPSTAAPVYYCIIRVTDNDGQTARDTTTLLLFAPPEAILVAPDSVPIWSGDRDIPTQNSHYHYGVNGSSSINGTFGDMATRQFWWNFSHVFPDQLFGGEADGTVDISYFEFDTAFTRPTAPMDIFLRMEFRDSILPPGEQDSASIATFYYRHASLAQDTVHFYRSWQRQGSDTVITSGAHGRVGLVLDGAGAPLLAHRDASGSGRVSRFFNQSWSLVGGGAFAPLADSIAMVRDPISGDIVVAFLDADGALGARRLVVGAGSWVHVGSPGFVAGPVADFDLKMVPGVGPLVSWLAADSIGRAMLYEGGSWGWNGIPGTSGAATNGVKVKRLRSAISSGGDSLYFAYSLASNDRPQARRYRRSNNSWGSLGDVYNSGARSLSAIVSPNGDFWVAFSNIANGGRLSVRRRSGTAWSTAGELLISRRPLGLSTSMALAADGNPIVAFEDPASVMPINANITVWKFDGTQWNMLGENLLPYFNMPFYEVKGYFLYALSPTLAVHTGTGEVFLGMIGRDSRGASNSGPMVLRHSGQQ